MTTFEEMTDEQIGEFAERFYTLGHSGQLIQREREALITFLGGLESCLQLALKLIQNDRNDFSKRGAK